MTVVKIRDGLPASVADTSELVDMLEELLARAKAGSITAMGVAFVNADGSVSTRWEGGDQTVPMIAAISMLQHEFLTGVGSAA